MYNQFTFAIILFVVSWVLLITSSVLFFRNNGKSLAICLLVLSGFLLRLQVSSDQFLHKWDERYHALVAKNILKNPLVPTLYENPVLPYDYKNWTSNHVWVHKPPATTYLLAASIGIFGVSDFSVRIPSILFSTLSIFVLYLIGKKLFNERIGFLSAVLFSINGLIIELTGGRVATDHVDTLFTSFILIAVYFSINHVETRSHLHFLLFSLFTALAILTKWLPGLITLPIWLALAFKRISIREIAVYILTSLILIFLVVSPWYFYIFTTFPDEARWENLHILRHISETLDDQTGPWYYFFDRLRINYGEVVYIPLIWFFYSIYKTKRDNSSITIATWFLLPYIFFSLASTKMQAYTVFASPSIFLITSIYFFYLREKTKNNKLLILKQLVLILLIILPVRYSFERAKPFKDQSEKKQWAQELKDLGKLYSGSKVVAFNVPAYIELMYYTDYIAYEFPPENRVIKELLDQGWTVLMNNTTTLPFSHPNIKSITLSTPSN